MTDAVCNENLRVYRLLSVKNQIRFVFFKETMYINHIIYIILRNYEEYISHLLWLDIFLSKLNKLTINKL